jgi:murein L,D-transpeptidase YcbB/YkuD
MRNFVVIFVVVALAISLPGCTRKEEIVDELQQPMTMETLSSSPVSPAISTEVKTVEIKPQVTSAVEQAKIGPAIPAGPFNPSATDIQTALKNAGYYSAEIDGKIGPKSKKAIEEFQRANGLKVDGKVGPKTWEVLSKHLTLVEPAQKPR